LQVDKKHAVRVYFRDRRHQVGKVTAVGPDSFTLQLAPNLPARRISYADVDRVTKEPADSEKFTRGLKETGLIIAGIPALPLMLLMFVTQN
jgi:hypothetical protein